MIVTKTFAWAHLPKAAGDTTSAILLANLGWRNKPLLSDPTDSAVKHTRFDAREELVADKIRVLNIRRLPAWILSYHAHASKLGVHPDYKPWPVKSPFEMSQTRTADAHLAPFIDHGQRPADRWLRVEHLEQDISDLLGKSVAIPEKLNVTGHDQKLDHWFTSEQIASMYAHNPLWADVESSVYGDLLTTPDDLASYHEKGGGMDTFLAIASRSEVREFADQDIPDEVVRRILEAGWVVSSGLRLVALRERELVAGLAKTIHSPSNLNGARLAVTIVANGGGGFNPGRIAQNMSLAAWNEGVGSTANRVTDQENASKLLALKEGERPFAVIGFGYPVKAREPEKRPAEHWLTRGKRKPFDEVVDLR